MSSVLDPETDLPLLSAACYRRDGPEIIRILAGRDPGLRLQHAGDALVVALSAKVSGASTFARDLIPRLSARDWDGDAER